VKKNDDGDEDPRALFQPCGRDLANGIRASAICGSTGRMAAEGPRNNSRHVTIKEMGNALEWLLGSGVAVVVRHGRRAVPSSRGETSCKSARTSAHPHLPLHQAAARPDLERRWSYR
jgi:hypothetical protein